MFICLFLLSRLNYRLRDDVNKSNDFEMLNVAFIKLNSEAFNVTASYRPLNCKEGFFDSLENIVCIFDVESKEIYMYHRNERLFVCLTIESL